MKRQPIPRTKNKRLIAATIVCGLALLAVICFTGNYDKPSGFAMFCLTAAVISYTLVTGIMELRDTRGHGDKK